MTAGRLVTSLRPWLGNGAERTEFRTYSGGGGRAGVRAQGVGTGRGHLAYLTHKAGLWIKCSELNGGGLWINS